MSKINRKINYMVDFQVYTKNGEYVSRGNLSVFFDRPPTFKMWSRTRKEILDGCIERAPLSTQRVMHGGTVLFVNTQEVALDEPENLDNQDAIDLN
jgi:hypothetical protein